MPFGLRAGPLDPAALGGLGLGGDAGLAHRRAIGPARMAVDALEPDRPVADDGVEIGGGREAAEAPALLVPAAADDPARRRVGGGISGDALLRLGERVGVGEVERERAHAEAHDVAVGVDQARDQGPAAAVEQVAGPLRPPVAALEQLLHPAVVADPERVEAVQAPVLAQRIAVDVLDQDVGEAGEARSSKAARNRRIRFKARASGSRMRCPAARRPSPGDRHRIGRRAR